MMKDGMPSLYSYEHTLRRNICILKLTKRISTCASGTQVFRAIRTGGTNQTYNYKNNYEQSKTRIF